MKNAGTKQMPMQSASRHPIVRIPKEEAPNCNHNFVTRVDGRMVCSFCGAIGFIDFASPEETLPVKEKPDFESPRQMIIRLVEEYRGKGKLKSLPRKKVLMRGVQVESGTTT